MPEQAVIRYSTIAAYVLSFLALLFVLHQELLGALMSGLLVHSLVHILAPRLERHFSNRRAKVVAVAALSSVIVGTLSVAIWAAVAFFQSDAGTLQALLQRLADMLEMSRSQSPAWLSSHIPTDAESLREIITNWLREHAADAKQIGERAGRSLAHILIGMIIGAMAALNERVSSHAYLPLAAALVQRLERLSCAFERVVFAQIRIAAINAVLTGIYLVVVLPLMGIHLPLSKTLVMLTFFAGLLPVVGNLLSNSVLVIVALSHSLYTALASLLFLVIIHKLEYFLNARIIGSHIHARIWELLVAMLAMEAVFGLYGLIAAPVLYAYIKIELMENRLV